MGANIASAEDSRMAVLDAFDVLDSPPEESFDRITRIAKNALDVPIAAITLIDGHRQWFKSRIGDQEREAPRKDSFCNVAIQLAEPLIVEDAAATREFSSNPYVVGPPYLRAYAGAQLRAPSGHQIGALCAIDTRPRKFEAKQITLLKDLAAMVMSELESQRLATTDSLTGVFSRRGFRINAERILALALRYRHPLSCIMFDLDHFKSINDRHGHSAGDRALVSVAEICRDRIRATDIVGRVGGEEFVVLLPHTDLAGTVQVAEEVRGALEKRSLSAAIDDPRPTASFGISTLDASVTTLDELLRRADLALYEAKGAGRNRCVNWQSAGSPVAVGHMRRVLKAGQIAFNSGRSVIDCTVRGLSEMGASLHVASTAGIPKAFKLAIVGDGLSRACSVSVKQDRYLEVVFE